MTSTLITGANKGLGRETARRLIELGRTVYLGCRDAGRGQQAAADLGGVPLLVDVTSDASVAAAAAQIRERAGLLDVLVNNAGVAGGLRPAAATTAADMLAVYDTNVFGVVRMLQAFIAERGKIVPRRISGVCAPHQRRLTDAILKARNIALLPFAAAV